MKKIESSAQDHYWKISKDHERLKSQLELQNRDLELRCRELMERQTHNEIESKKLAEDLEQVYISEVVIVYSCIFIFGAQINFMERS